MNRRWLWTSLLSLIAQVPFALFGMYIIATFAVGSTRGAIIVGAGFALWLVGSLIWVYLIYPRLRRSHESGHRVSGRKWIDYVLGAVGLVLGIALFVPGCSLLISPLFGFYTVGLTPHWLRHALYGLSVLATLQIVGSINRIRWAGSWE
jgi:hypothetical protein